MFPLKFIHLFFSKTSPARSSSLHSSQLGIRSFCKLVQPSPPVKESSNLATATIKKDACGPEIDDDELEELEEMFVQGPAGVEWGGPTRGGQRPEPTRYGDWERKGRASDF